VLLDSATPEQFTALPNYPGCYSTDRRVSGVLPTLARLGVGRIVAATQSAGLPAQARQHEQAFVRNRTDKLALLSSNSVHRTIDGATHAELLVDRRFAQPSSTAIVQVAAAARTHAAHDERSDGRGRPTVEGGPPWSLVVIRRRRGVPVPGARSAPRAGIP
jgi:hypothetical protein